MHTSVIKSYIVILFVIMYRPSGNVTLCTAVYTGLMSADTDGDTLQCMWGGEG